MAKKTKENQMKACMKPHAMLHTIFGLGIGLMISTFFTSISPMMIFVLGVVFAVISIFGELFLKER